MMFDITLAIFLAVAYSLVWIKISELKGLIDELNVRFLYLERKKMKYSGKIDFWGLPDCEYMECKTIEELVDRYLQNMEIDEEEAEEEITIYGYVKLDIEKGKDRLVDWLLENTLEHMDEEYTLEHNNKAIADIPAVRFVAMKLIKTIINNGYRIETLDKVCEKKIKISDYIEKES